MQKVRIYDLPTRLFHGLFALAFITAFGIANFVDDESNVFSFHMLAGLIMGFCIIWRIIWGVVGTRHARWSDFTFAPAKLKHYLAEAYTGRKHSFAGHNPASSWAAVLMILLGILMVTTGCLMILGLGGEIMEEAHELIANTFLLVVVLHIAGIVIHQLQYKDNMHHSMLHGYKRITMPAGSDVVQHKLAGSLFLTITLVFAAYLISNYTVETRTLTVFSQPFVLAEPDHEDYEYDNQHED
ncbi:cytochrome b/b6 domain-containing protein [Alteromonas flava]|uniref:cytochrome b/b6 domain-containing protein n=1 Tax=Alteromonas flava TaxID=2048003 RepID=UPI000C28C4D9|nr:cytochrome b/b6 domain-containing protein [Alteromonas flava]